MILLHNKKRWSDLIEDHYIVIENVKVKSSKNQPIKEDNFTVFSVKVSNDKVSKIEMSLVM